MRRRPDAASAALFAIVLVAAACTGGSKTANGSGPSASTSTAAGTGVPGSPGQRPNILLVVSDDQAWSTFDRTLMPGVFERLVDHGVLFRRAYDSSSLCCPSRSEILTGLWEHHTGVDDNDIALERPTIVEALHDIGYRTMLAGKYLNSAPCTPRPEFDRWACVSVAPSSYSLHDPLVNVDGTWTRFPGAYQTDVLGSMVSDFVASTPANQPFFAMYTPTSPHLPADDPRYADLGVTPPRGPAYDEDTAATNKPDYLHRSPFSAREQASIGSDYTKMAHAVRSLDDSVSAILDRLGDRAQRTLVIYTSDNGYLYGEHRWVGKGVPYQEGVDVPLIVRYPPWTGAGDRVTDGLAANVDIAATIAEAAGIPWGADGRSLEPLITGAARSVRDAVLLSRCNGEVRRCVPVPEYWGVVTARYEYIQYGTGDEELYDLASDPHELRNLAVDPSADAERTLARRVLTALRAPPPIQTTIVSGPAAAGSSASGGASTSPPGMVEFRYFSQSRFATYRCRFVRGSTTEGWFPCDPDGLTAGPLAPGRWAFEVAGSDGLGHTDSSPAVRRFEVGGSASLPVLSVGDARIREGDSGGSPVTFTVSLDRRPRSPVTVRVATQDDTAAGPSQFVPVAGTLTFEPGQRAKRVTVLVKGDTIHEPNERFELLLSDPHGAALGDDRGTATIVDDDPARSCSITGTNGDDHITGTPGPDVICGLGGDDVIEGAGGDDVLIGGPGNDVLIGGSGNDVLDGGTGVDTARFPSSDTVHGVAVSLEEGVAFGTDTGRDSIVVSGSRSSVERVEGSDGPDLLVGDAGPNVLNGGAGDDVLFGRDGADGLYGASGNDRLSGEGGDDVLLPGAGDDAVDGGPGTDYVSYADLGGRPGAPGVTVDLAAKQATGSSGTDGADAAGSDLLTSIENAAGSPSDDVLLGSGGNDILSGLDGTDRLDGRGGDDLLIGGPGDDTVDGGPGKDVADETATSGGPGNDRLIDVEQVIRGQGSEEEGSGSTPPGTGGEGGIPEDLPSWLVQ